MERNVEFKKPFQKPAIGGQNLLREEMGWTREAGDSLNKSLEQERKPGEPKISINIFYGSHGTGRDIEGLQDAFAEADVFIPEFWTWRDRELQDFRSLSEGVKKPSDVIKGIDATEEILSFFYTQLKMIYNSNKHIALIDVPMDEEWGGFLVPHYDGIYMKGTFNEALESKRQKIKHYANGNKDREAYMQSHLLPKVQELLREYPVLKEKEEVKILLFLGAGHTQMYHNLIRSGQKATRMFSEMPYVYDFTTEGIRRYAFGNEVNDLLAARIILEELFNNSFGLLLLQRILKSEKRTSIGRKIIAQFSLEEAKDIFEQLKKGQDIKQLFEIRLRDKGITIPRSEEELDEFLAKPLSQPTTPPEQKS